MQRNDKSMGTWPLVYRFTLNYNHVVIVLSFRFVKEVSIHISIIVNISKSTHIELMVVFIEYFSYILENIFFSSFLEIYECLGFLTFMVSIVFPNINASVTIKVV